MEGEIKKIEAILAKYDYISVVKYLAFMLTRLTERHTLPFFKYLNSPYKQLHYVASLALKIKSKGVNKISDEDWNTISLKLKNIEELYISEIPKNYHEIDMDTIKKNGVSKAAFMNYFFNGTFAFKEQLIERIQKTFEKYDDTITNEVGLSVNDFIECFENIITECNIKLNLPLDIQNNGDWISFTDKMVRLNIPAEQWKIHFSDELKAAFNALTQPESILLINPEKLHVKCDKAKLLIFLEFLTVSELNSSSIIYYGEKLPLELNPFVKISDNEYLFFYQNEVLSAIYEKLVSICSQKIGAKFYKHRDTQTEIKTLDIFGHIHPKLFQNKT